MGIGKECREKSVLTSLQNPLVKQFRKLHTAKERHKQGLFLLEGTNLVTEAVAVAFPLQTVCCTERWQKNHLSLWNQLSQQCRTELVSEEIISAIATTINPDGVVAIASRSVVTHKIPFTGIVLVLETIQDPGNLGTIIRTAAAADVSGLWISQDSVDLDHPKVMRASAGQWFRLPMQVSPDLLTTVNQAKTAGMQVISTLPTAEKTFWEVDWRKPSLILLGNEGAGLSNQLSTTADMAVNIPLANQVESLNVAIATALMVYEAYRQRFQDKYGEIGSGEWESGVPSSRSA